MPEDKIKVLLIDDDEDDYVIVRETLSEIRNSVFEVFWAAGYRQAKEMIEEREYDICLMDYRLGETNGIELMREFIAQGVEIPIIILTGHGDHDSDLQAMQEGAVDYLEKGDLESVQLERAIRYAIRNSDMVKALRASQEKLRELSNRILEAQENERKSLARELHDSIGSGLTAVCFALERKLDSMGSGAVAGSEALSLEHIIEMIREIIEESQRISSNLRPSTLDTLGLLPAIRSFCRKHMEVYKDVELETQLLVEEEDVPGKLKIIFYRIIQEALNNAAKHSQARHMNLNLSKTNDHLSLVIKDDGKSFDVDTALLHASESDSLGLMGMIERVKLSGGEIEILSEAGKGTAIKAQFPISTPSPSQ